MDTRRQPLWELAREVGGTYIPGLKTYAVHDKDACSRSAEQLPLR